MHLASKSRVVASAVWPYVTSSLASFPPNFVSRCPTTWRNLTIACRVEASRVTPRSLKMLPAASATTVTAHARVLTAGGSRLYSSHLTQHTQSHAGCETRYRVVPPPSRHWLPLSVELRRCRRRVVVERLSADSERQIYAVRRRARQPAAQELVALIDVARLKRDNVGEDELQDLQSMVSSDKCGVFTVRDPVSDELLAGLLLEPFHAARTVRPRLAHLHIVSAQQLADANFIGDLSRLGCDLAVELGRGFTSCVTPVYCECPRRVAALRREDFLVAAAIPQAGRLHDPRRDGEKTVKVWGNKSGYSNSYLMYRKLDVEERPPYTEADMERLMDEACGGDSQTDETALWTSAPVAPGLPVTIASQSGLRLRLRTIKPDDVDTYYKEHIKSADHDEGMRRDGIPTRLHFSRQFSRGWNMVAEEADRGRLVAVYSLASSPFSRSRRSVLADTSLLITPEYRRNGMAVELMHVMFRLAVDLGFSAILSDSAVDNLSGVSLANGTGVLAVGTLPDAMYSPQTDDKSNDVLVLYKSLDDVQGLADWLKTQTPN